MLIPFIKCFFSARFHPNSKIITTLICRIPAPLSINQKVLITNLKTSHYPSRKHKTELTALN